MPQGSSVVRPINGLYLFTFTPGKDPVPIVQEAGWASGPAWTGAENLAPTGLRSPDRPARRQSLYRLRYPAHCSASELLKFLLSHIKLQNITGQNRYSSEPSFATL